MPYMRFRLRRIFQDDAYHSSEIILKRSCTFLGDFSYEQMVTTSSPAVFTTVEDQASGIVKSINTPIKATSTGVRDMTAQEIMESLV
ncbi:hypothetical protein E3N88_26362 [Mikania micrantha]|uniref:Uncharacterized protein n=1 Tax=Mikania micrantha TaxID=192012 RepID=A0A5N6N942_9ASTR|nr:hypothetical protein E3N88_26362 [Mikania micrantha]